MLQRANREPKVDPEATERALRDRCNHCGAHHGRGRLPHAPSQLPACPAQDLQ